MVVFFDIDGTIVDDRTQIIPESTLRAVEQLNRNGHIPMVNTGRPYSHIDPRVRAMAFRGWVCGCGMEILLDGNWLSRIRLTQEQQDFIIRCVEQYRMKPLYETDDGGIMVMQESFANPHIRKESSRMARKHFPVRILETGERPVFMKLVVFREADSDQAGFIREMEPDFTIIDRGNTMLEIIPKGCSKAAGMQLALDRLGASREETYAIGDSTNDLPMFSVAGHTVCLGGGMEELKAVSEYITAPVMDDGIEKALKHFGLI